MKRLICKLFGLVDRAEYIRLYAHYMKLANMYKDNQEALELMFDQAEWNEMKQRQKQMKAARRYH